MHKTPFPITVPKNWKAYLQQKNVISKKPFYRRTWKFPTILLHINFPSVFPLHNLNYILNFIVYGVIKAVLKFKRLNLYVTF